MVISDYTLEAKEDQQQGHVYHPNFQIQLQSHLRKNCSV